MQPYARVSLKELAIMDPVAALGRVLGLQTRPVSLNAIASFSSLAIGQIPVRVPLDQVITKRTWIDCLSFDLQLPNAFVGNIFLPQAIATLKAGPGVSVRTTVMSGPRYLVSDTYTPIENYVNLIKPDWGTGWQVYKFQQIFTEFMLTAIPFNDPSNTPPYNVTLTYNGWQFDDSGCDEISCDGAIQELIKRGVCEAAEFGRKTFCPTS